LKNLDELISSTMIVLSGIASFAILFLSEEWCIMRKMSLLPLQTLKLNTKPMHWLLPLLVYTSSGSLLTYGYISYPPVPF
jgi:hypothetical protein